MGGLSVLVWGRTPHTPEAIGSLCLKILQFFCNNNLILGLVWSRLLLLKSGMESSTAKT